VVIKLLSARWVKPFVGGDKNDVADARAIWTAVQQPGIKTVAVKSEAQQAVLALHRMRQQLVKFRTAQINPKFCAAFFVWRLLILLCYKL
jgi:transposase